MNEINEAIMMGAREIHRLREENEQLKRQIDIKNKYCQLIIDIGFDYDGLNQSDSLKALIDELVQYANKSIKADDKTVIYSTDYKKCNILGEELKGDNYE